jgi:transcriptional regulator with XRE-family HTH domain
MFAAYYTFYVNKAPISYNDDDVALSKFALAFGLPVRIFIIRTIVEQHNAASKNHFESPLFKPELVHKHIAQLKNLGILQTRTEKGKTTYSTNKAFFGQMSEKFSLLFASMRDMNNSLPVQPAVKEHDTEPQLNFGSYLKNQRLSFQFTQEAFAKHLNMERAKLSKIETGKAVFPAEKLEALATIIYEDLAKLKKIYYSDHLVTLIQDGHIDATTFEFAKKKAEQQ